ncbi:MAG: hypothetical protein LUO89_13250 [Methanothrix sp.]|nr:hypothetical protein [Methanothrix sp.]
MKLHPLFIIALLLAPNVIPANAIAAHDNSSDQSLAIEIDDSGFRPETNGFPFQNYGNDPAIVDLTPVEMQRMFGDKVCASTADGKCVLTYPAKRWMEEAIKAMGYGHCEGIAVLSDLIYYNLASPDRFGGNITIELALRNELLQREIGYWWVTQVTNPGGSNKVNESPNSVIDVLMKAFSEGQNATEWWVMGIYLPDGSGGHSITPFAVEDMGNGTFKILVYDNNWPKERRAIYVDRNSNTWSYIASVNPNEPSEVYTGNGSTKSLEIVSVSARLGLQECDFCEEDDSSGLNSSKGALKGQKHIQIWQDGNVNTLVTDEHGQRVGFLESGNPVNEIPNAEIRNLRFGFGMGVHYPPVIFVPIQSDNVPDITINISSEVNSSEENKNGATTTIIAPGLSVVSSIPDLEQGQQQSIDLAQAEEGYAVSFSNNQALSPTISINSNLHEITISGVNIDPDGRVNINMDPADGSLGIRTIGNINPGTAQLKLTSIDKKSGEVFTFNSLGLSLRPNDGVSLNFADSVNKVGIPSLSISHENGVTEKAMLVLTDMSGETYQMSFDSFVKDVLSSPDFTGMGFRSSIETVTLQAPRSNAGSPPDIISTPRRG